jgi:hypothetical protein
MPYTKKENFKKKNTRRRGGASLSPFSSTSPFSSRSEVTLKAYRKSAVASAANRNASRKRTRELRNQIEKSHSRYKEYAAKRRIEHNEEMEEMLNTLSKDPSLGYKIEENMDVVIAKIEEIAKNIDVKNWKGVSTLLNMYKSYKQRKFTIPGNNVALNNVEQQLKILHAILTDVKLTSNDQFEKWSNYSLARLRSVRVNRKMGAAQAPNE